jgi:lipid A 3-O-deacylase
LTRIADFWPQIVWPRRNSRYFCPEFQAIFAAGAGRRHVAAAKLGYDKVMSGGISMAACIVQRSASALAAVFAVLISLGPAVSADLPAAPAYIPPTAPATVQPMVYDPEGFEFRFGGFAHGVGGVEQGTYDLNGEFVTPRLPFFEDSWWSVFMPRANVGGLLNLEGRTSAVYAGALWTIPLPYHLFAEGFLDGDLHNGYLNNPPPGRSGLGCRYMFHDGGSIGYKMSEHWKVMFTFDHQSNGHGIFGTECDGMGSATRNPGINDYGLRLGYAF